MEPSNLPPSASSRTCLVLFFLFLFFHCCTAEVRETLVCNGSVEHFER